MPTIRSLQSYTYPSEEVKEAIFIKKNNRLFFPTKELEKKYKHFTLSEEDDNSQLVFKNRILVSEDKVRDTIDKEYKKSFAGMNRVPTNLKKVYRCIRKRGDQICKESGSTAIARSNNHTFLTTNKRTAYT